MAETISMPKLGFDMAEGTLIRWVKSEGEQVIKGDILAEIETDKATVEVEAQTSGVMRKHVVQEGSIVPVGSVIAVLADAEEEFDLESLLQQTPETPAADQPEPSSAPPTPEAEPAVAPPDTNGKLPGGVKATPIARRIAKEQGVDLRTLVGSGQGGRIVKEDVEQAIQGLRTGIADIVGVEDSSVPSLTSESTTVPLTKLRSLIGRRMTTAKQQVPHFYLTAEYDAVPLMELRSELNARLPEGEKLSVNDFIVKAAALALRQFPNLNATLQGDQILRQAQINIGIAVAVDDGLLTIVVRDADVHPIRVISVLAKEAIGRAREGRVRPEDVEGSTFTVSNLGMFDIENFIAIINPPEAAILAVGTVMDVPVVKDGQVVPGRRFKVTLSSDHRVTDGAEAAQWLQTFKEYVEDPLKLLL
jgi:pyruvate dehydrogenase E2 component (dihydrolipoamide acetyltransferase)